MDKILKIVEVITDLKTKKDLILIALDGNGGGGKTTLSRHLKKEIPELRVLRSDLYPSSKGKTINFKIMNLRDELLLPLINNQIATPQIYDWPNKRFVDGPAIEPLGIILLEGTLTMHEELLNFYDYKIWIDCPADVGMNRALARDNNAYKEKWENEWIPRMLNYIVAQDPKSKADIVLSYKEIPEFI